GIGLSPIATTKYSYTDGYAGDLTEVTDPAGHVTDYTYDGQGDLATVTTHPTSGLNDTTAFVYDRLGRKTCETSPDATAASVQCPLPGDPRVADTSTWTYNADGDVTSVTDPRGKETDYGYDGDGNQTLVTDPIGNVTKTNYDADSRKSTVIAGYGTAYAATTSYHYDIQPGTGACSSSVTGATYCTTSIDPGGQTTVDYFNSRNEQIQESQPTSGTTTSTYDPAGNLSTLTTNGGKATYGYDAANELTAITYSNPATGYAAASNVSYAYDADGMRTSMSDGSGTTSYSYDSLERLSSTTNGAGATIGYGYDLDNEITSITYPGRSQTVNQTWDGAGRESIVTDWLGHSTNFSYDADGNLTGQSNPNSTTISSTYDTADNLLTTQDAPTANPSSALASATYTYNPDSQVQTETDTGTPGPSSQSYNYDPLDRLSTSSTGSYGYDASGDPTQLAQAAQTFNAQHQVTSQVSTISGVGTTSAGDNGTGSTLTLTLPSGVQANDQILLAVTLPGNQTIKSTPSGYTQVGSYSSGAGASNTQLVLYRRTAQTGDTAATVTFSKTFAKAANLIVYRGVNPVTPIDASSNGTTASGTSVVAPSVTATKGTDELVVALAANSSAAGTWTAPSQMTTQRSQAGGPTIASAVADQALTSSGSTGSRTATFSTTGSLVAAMVALQPAQTSYGYDSLGDRTSITSPGGTTALSYDQLGRVTTYGSTNYAYNGDGVRVSKATGHTTEALTWSPSGLGGTPQLLADGSTDYINGPDGHPLEQINGSTVLYYLHDELGSTRALTNASGTLAGTYTYTPYGTLSASTGTAANPLGFAGSYTDTESGLLYLQHRYYDPATGQFSSVDPAVDQTQAAYAYVDGDPVDYVDPYGLGIGIDIGVGAAIGGLVGGVVGGGTYLYGAATGQHAFSWSGLGAATVSGAVGGLVTGACVGATWVEWSACGALGGAAATAVSNLIHGTPVTCNLVAGTVAGGVGGALGGYLFPLRGFRPYKYANIYKPGLNSLRLYGQAYTSAVIGSSAGASP
ncbi:MAG TPA: RHS repeat-associated core domain-containing protein, partial [Mycobacteriales bacterium]